MIDYSKRLAEVDEILNYLSKNDLSKIPEDVRQAIKDNKDKEYIWKFDTSKPLKEQKLSRDTIAILSYLNMEYLLNDEQKELMEKIHEENEKKEEIYHNMQFDSKKLFKDKVNDNFSNEKKEIIEYKKKGLFQTIIDKLKRMLKK